MRRVIVAVLCWAGATSIAAGQAVPPMPGLPWVGCWEAADVPTADGVTCVVPEVGGALRIVAVTGASRSETRLRLDGERVPLEAEGCTGWQRARLTPDGERILLDGERACDDLPRLQTAGAFVLTAGGEWWQAQGGGVATVVMSQVRRYRPVANTLTIPADLRPFIGPYQAEAELARSRIQGIPVSARDLEVMERMGTAPAILDVIVAASYPESFAIGRGAVTPVVAEARPTDIPSVRRTPLYIGGGRTLSYYDWAFGGWYGPCGAGWGMMDPLGCGWFPMVNVAGGVLYAPPYVRYGAAWPYGGWYGGGWYGAPYGGGIVIRPIASPGGEGAPGTGGRMVRGRGYVRDGDEAAGPRSAQPRGGGSSVRTEGGGAGSVSTGSGSSGSGGGSSSAPRTAKRRDP